MIKRIPAVDEQRRRLQQAAAARLDEVAHATTKIQQPRHRNGTVLVTPAGNLELRDQSFLVDVRLEPQ